MLIPTLQRFQVLPARDEYVPPQPTLSPNDILTSPHLLPSPHLLTSPNLPRHTYLPRAIATPSTSTHHHHTNHRAALHRGRPLPPPLQVHLRTVHQANHLEPLRRALPDRGLRQPEARPPDAGRAVQAPRRRCRCRVYMTVLRHPGLSIPKIRPNVPVYVPESMEMISKPCSTPWRMRVHLNVTEAPLPLS